MKYIANPVIVDAFKIAEIGGAENVPEVGTVYHLVLEDGQRVTTDPGMTSRMTPTVGDYWVVQADGYIYLNPRAVFERKYSIDPDHAARIHKVPVGESGSGQMA